MKTICSVKVWLAIFVLGLFLVGMGCESKKTASVEQPKQKEDPNSPCALLTKEEVQAVLKQKLEEPKRDDILCIYESVVKSPSATLVVQLNPTEPEAFMQNRKDFMKGPNPFKPVEGLGENAYFYNESLNVLAKKRALSMRFEGTKPSEDDIINLAKKAVERIR